MRTRIVFGGLLTVAVALTAGCGGGGEPTPATVTGEVKVDGVVLAKGNIIYSPDGTTKWTPRTAEIVDGKYSAQTLPGVNKVRIVSTPTKKIKESNSPDANWLEIPGEGPTLTHNGQTEMSFEVKSGSNTKDWELNAKKK